MKLKLKNAIPSLLITLVILIILEIITTAFFPALGVSVVRLPFHVLLVLYVAFKLDSPLISLIIFSIEYVHGFFSIEGWAIGTFTGVMIGIIISYLRDLIHFSTSLATILIIQLFQIVWFVITSFLIYLREDDYAFLIDRSWKFIPESVIISVLSPLLFIVLDKIWKLDKESMVGEDE